MSWFGSTHHTLRTGAVFPIISAAEVLKNLFLFILIRYWFLFLRLLKA